MLYKPWIRKFFKTWNHHKCLSYLFPLQLNTQLMGLRPLLVSYFFQRGDSFYTSESDVCRRQILAYKDGPRAERIERQCIIILNYISHDYADQLTIDASNWYFCTRIQCRFSPWKKEWINGSSMLTWLRTSLRFAKIKLFSPSWICGSRGSVGENVQ